MGKKSNLFINGLKVKKALKGLIKNNPKGAKLAESLAKADPDYAKKSDIKWNFTKFLVDRQGHVVERFEPIDEKNVLIPAIEAELKK